MSQAIETRIVKAFSTDVSVSEGERAVIARISTIDVDREGEVLIPRGCDTRDFEKNPVVFFGHNYWTLPIGKCVSIKRTEEEMIAKTIFASRPDEHPEGEEWLPDTLFALYQQGVMNAFSVGFVPIESRPATDKDIDKYGAGARRIYSKWRMHEYSAVPLPCNQAAVTMAVAKGYASSAFAKGVFDIAADAAPRVKYAIDAEPSIVRPRHRVAI